MIISSLLDTDLYKFTMMLFAHEKYPDLNVEYEFKCRSKVSLVYLMDRLKTQVEFYTNLRFTKDEVAYLCTIDKRFSFLEEFVNKKLMDFHSNVKIYSVHDELFISVKGKWWMTILYEVPILAIVNELHSKMSLSSEKYAEALSEGTARLTKKIRDLKNHKDLKIMEFGTRRRFSREWQEMVLIAFMETPNLIGTSNVKLAMDHGLTPLGSMAHECFQAFQGIYHPVKSQIMLLKEWHEFFGSEYSIALTDIFPQKKFLKDFKTQLATRYAGVRHDSGCPFQWSEEIIEHYKSLAINPKNKTLIYSDGLDIPLAIKLHQRFSNQVRDVYGIGTNLTNDMGTHKALQVVMKIITVDGLPVAKISNNIEKSMCRNPLYLAALQNMIAEDIKNG